MEPASVVILDFEATGLPFTRPRVTEVAALAITLQRYEELMREWDGKPLKSDALPEGLRTLQFLVNPVKPTSAGWLNGLTNEILSKEAPFSKKTLGRIIEFIRPLPSPVAIMAHNGRRFDFPLLLKEIKLCSGEAEWGELGDVRVVDSMAALRVIEKAWLKDLQAQALQYEYDSQATAADVGPSPCPVKKEPVERVTRKRKRDASLGSRLLRRLAGEENEAPVEMKPVEMKPIEMRPIPTSLTTNAIQCLPFVDSSGWNMAKRTRLPLQVAYNGRRVTKKKKTGSFSEGKVFGELFPGWEEPNHRALADCLGLLSICWAYGDDFLLQLRSLHSPLANVHPMA